MKGGVMANHTQPVRVIVTVTVQASIAPRTTLFHRTVTKGRSYSNAFRIFF
ncbi:hypothetical protein CKC_03535 [Candidatus Liberibacter solanacearum CLso-ZC1]|uniref:Uncharacterized protein n=1 Tax=Liberibacter solanacearum (strain CLso-ZC1) TaxID=658172 RepID=E4UBF1_LIBSC|nr:hypothetical protein CKC_03535 [Candidatus Liberibacter solanacearum CLso-ZC1]